MRIPPRIPAIRVVARPGHGELVPTAKIRLDEQGSILIEDHSADLVPLSNVVGK